MRELRTYTEEEKKQILDEVKAIGNMAAVAKKNNMPVATIHTWIKPKYKKKNSQEISVDLDKMRSLQNKLKDAELEIQILKELLKKTYQVWNTN